MKFKTRNYRKVSSADIELSKLTMIVGKNGAGKSSLLDSIRCVSIGDPNPFKDIPTKKHASMLVHSGAPSGFAEMIEGENKARIDYPALEYKTEGESTIISSVSAGVESLTDMKKGDRINYIVDMMKAKPTENDLLKALMESNIVTKKTYSYITDHLENDFIDLLISKKIVSIVDYSKIKGIFTSDSFKPDIKESIVQLYNDTYLKKTNFFNSLWDNLHLQGWDNTHKQAKEKGAKFKGQWELITGANYGIRIAEQWRPEAYVLDLEQSNEGDLITEINKAKEAYENALKETAITDNEINELNKKKNQNSIIKQAFNIIEKAFDTCEKMRRDKIQERADLDANLNIGQIMSCPGCKLQLVVKDGNLIHIPGDHEKFKSDLKKQIKKLDEDIKSLKVQADDNLRQFSDKKAELKASDEAIKQLNKVGKLDKGKEQGSIEEMKNSLEHAENRLDAFNTFKKAHGIADNIKLNKKLQDILAPAGLRNKKLKSSIDKINKSMDRLTDYVGWKKTELNDSCDILCNGVPYGRLIAKSERYRVDILLQLMVAMAEKSPFVIIDNADELVKTTRSELMKVILKAGIQCIIACAIDEKEPLPPLEKVGGLCYKIFDGEVK